MPTIAVSSVNFCLLCQSSLQKEKLGFASELSKHVIFYIPVEVYNLIFVYLIICDVLGKMVLCTDVSSVTYLYDLECMVIGFWEK